MRLWAEEARSGTIELLFTLPISPAAAVLAKFLAAWAVMALALALTFPMWLTVAWLRRPRSWRDRRGLCRQPPDRRARSRRGRRGQRPDRNQVVAFILGVALCLLVTSPARRR